jgi:hypothetical protein
MTQEVGTGNDQGNAINSITFSQQEIKDELIIKERWKHQLYITWLSFLILIFIVFYIIFGENVNEIKVNGLTFYGMIFSAIVLAFFGATSMTILRK